jgi:hypothetical protein
MKFLFASSSITGGMAPVNSCYESTADKTSVGNARSVFSTSVVSTDAKLNEIDFLQQLFRKLEEAQVRYCVLQRWDALLGELHTDHDVDIAVHPGDADKLPRVWKALKKQGYQPMELLNHAVNSYAFIFGWFEDAALRTIMVDIAFEHRQGGLIWKSAEELIAGREKQGELWAAAPGIEFEYLLVKKMLKGTVKVQREKRFELLVKRAGREQAERIAGGLFGQGRKKEIVEACMKGGPGPLLRKFKRRFLWKQFLRNPFNLIRFVVADAWRLSRRWFQPTGVFLTLVGSDESQKDRFAARLIEKVAPAFGSQKVFRRSRIRPNATQNETPATCPSSPNGRAFRSAFIRLAARSRFLLEYVLQIRPLLARTNLVILEQSMDQSGVNENGNRSWASKSSDYFTCFSPKPELIFLLETQHRGDASFEPGLPRTEPGRPGNGHEAPASTVGNVHRIHSDQEIEPTVQTATHFLVDYLVQRFQRRHGRWLALDN